MVVLKPVVKISLSWGRGWQKPFSIDSDELRNAVWKALREKIPYDEAIIVPLKSDKIVARAACVYYNEKTGKVDVVLLYPLLVCET